MDNLNEQLVKIIDFWCKNISCNKLFDREIIKCIDLQSKEIVDLVGLRRSGKSSIFKLIIKDLNTKSFLYINFEDPFFITHNNPEIIEDIIEIYKEYFNPKLKYVFFDEIQEIKNWEKALRKLRDVETYKIFITGSSSQLLSKEISSLITGRHLSYPIFPLSFKEFLLFKKIIISNKKDIILKNVELIKKFNEYTKIGGFPEAVITNNQELLKNYFYDILEKDIIRRYDVREKNVLEKLAVYLLSNSGNISSIESLKKTFAISFLPITAYLEYLKDSYLIYEVPQFSYSLKKQEKAFKKFYSADVGLSNVVSFKFSEDKGRILENIVMLHLKQKFDNLYYFRTKNNLEVDFVIKEKNEFRAAIQVTWELDKENVKNREIKALKEAMDELKLDKGYILTNNEKGLIKVNNKIIKIMPVYEWLLQ